MCRFDASSIHPSAMWDEESIHPKIETGFAYTKEMNDGLVEKINTQTFNQGSAISKTLYYNPRDLIVQHLIWQSQKK